MRRSSSVSILASKSANSGVLLLVVVAALLLLLLQAIPRMESKTTKTWTVYHRLLFPAVVDE